MGKQKHDIGVQKRKRHAARHEAESRLVSDERLCHALAERLVRLGLRSPAIITSSTRATGSRRYRKGN